MKLLSFRVNNETRLGLLVKSSIVDIAKGCDHLFGEVVPCDMLGFLEEGEEAMVKARKLEKVATTSLKRLPSAPDAIFRVGEVELLAPIPRTRKNIICLGLNYIEHSQEVGLPLPKYPIFFTKPPTSIIGPDASVLFPKSTSKVDYEAELAFVFGKKGKNVSEGDAFNYVAGYTVFNDITARDLQGKYGQWFKGKGLDTFSSIGPYIVTTDELSDPHNLEISLELNGRLMQKSNTKNMIFKIPALVKHITLDMTVEPGDVVATGTPSGVGYTRTPPVYLKPGDVMKVSVERVGVLQNMVVSQ